MDSIFHLRFDAIWGFLAFERFVGYLVVTIQCVVGNWIKRPGVNSSKEDNQFLLHKVI